ncbi:MAG TPA: NlpC/P60 family protein [Abditibacteriaceae bacterium]|jgi:hypothetical protein
MAFHFKMNEPIKRPAKWRRWALVSWLLLWPLLAALHWYPIRDAYSRLGLLVTLLLIGIGALCLFWKVRAMRGFCVVLVLLFLAAFLAPGRNVNARQMQQDYVNALRAYTNTPYVWGGENHRGIDCSGLLRAALIDANWKHGLLTTNPRLLRRAFEIWWHDSSAQALGNEYRGWTKILFSTPSLNSVDYSRLQPGDIAVTEGGAHCLAYLGDKTWIEADPNALVGDKVIQVKAPSKNAWFSQPMRILRWRQFADKP